MVGTTIHSIWGMGGVATVLKEVDGIDLETAAEADVDVAGIGKEGFPAIPGDNFSPWKAA